MYIENSEYAGSTLESLIVIYIRNFINILKFKELVNQQR